MTTGHLGIMQIARVAQSCRLGNTVEYGVGPDTSRLIKKIHGIENVAVRH